MARDSGSNSGIKWVVGTLIALLAAGSGIVALLNYIHPTSEGKNVVTPTSALASAQSQADVIVCLRYTGYRPDPHVQGSDLEYQYQLLNRGTAEAIVTSIHIGVFGPDVKSGKIIPTNLDTVQGLNIPVPGKTLTSLMTNYIYVGAVTESSFQYAQSSVIWTNGRSQQFTHVNKGSEWSNDSAC